MKFKPSLDLNLLFKETKQAASIIAILSETQ